MFTSNEARTNTGYLNQLRLMSAMITIMKSTFGAYKPNCNELKGEKTYACFVKLYVAFDASAFVIRIFIKTLRIRYEKSICPQRTAVQGLPIRSAGLRLIYN